MDSNKLNEKVNVADEILDDVSGGASIFNEYHCTLCRRYISSHEAVKYNNKIICKDCMNKINNP